MNTHSNTPADGDFVRYLERLTTGDLAVVVVKQSLAESDGPGYQQKPQQLQQQKQQQKQQQPNQQNPQHPDQALSSSRPSGALAASPAATAANAGSQNQAQSVNPAQAQKAMERLAVHLKWAAVILGVTQILGFFVPGGGSLLLPALVAYVFYSLYHRPEDAKIGSVLVQRLRDIAANQKDFAGNPASRSVKNKPPRS